MPLRWPWPRPLRPAEARRPPWRRSWLPPSTRTAVEPSCPPLRVCSTAFKAPKTPSTRPYASQQVTAFDAVSVILCQLCRVLTSATLQHSESSLLIRMRRRPVDRAVPGRGLGRVRVRQRRRVLRGRAAVPRQHSLHHKPRRNPGVCQRPRPRPATTPALRRAPLPAPILAPAARCWLDEQAQGRLRRDAPASSGASGLTQHSAARRDVQSRRLEHKLEQNNTETAAVLLSRADTEDRSMGINTI